MRLVCKTCTRGRLCFVSIARLSPSPHNVWPWPAPLALIPVRILANSWHLPRHLLHLGRCLGLGAHVRHHKSLTCQEVHRQLARPWPQKSLTPSTPVNLAQRGSRVSMPFWIMSGSTPTKSRQQTCCRRGEDDDILLYFLTTSHRSCSRSLMLRGRGFRNLDVVLGLTAEDQA